MARRVFFSFHYDDVKSFRVNVVRNAWVVQGKREESFVDGSLWEKAKTNGTTAIKNLIDNIGLKHTSVTAVLIGGDTHDRRWVKYEIVRSFERGNGIFSVNINRIKDKSGSISSKGLNPLDRLGLRISRDGRKIEFLEFVDRKWQLFADLPEINNKKSNTIYFPSSFWGNKHWGEAYKFSDFFPTYDWVKDSGSKNFPDWVESAINAKDEEYY
jgi:hypothetical protein